MEKEFSTPILILIFNRPDAVQKLVDCLREIKPTKIYIGADGPRKNKSGEAEKCQKTRAIIENIDWQCTIEKNFQNDNLGCRKAVYGAISWFFDNEEKGIILEDDCLPDPSFFKYSAELLKRYSNNPRIMHIGGDNPIAEATSTITESYCYTQMPLVWGWATWKTAWKKMNLELSELDRFDYSVLPYSSLAQKYLKEKFNATQQKENDSWAYAWYYTILAENGISILPKNNLVSNIGFSKEATHTKSNAKGRALKTHSLNFPLIAPKEISVDRGLEKNLFYAAQKSKMGLWGRAYLPVWFRRMFGGSH